MDAASAPPPVGGGGERDRGDVAAVAGGRARAGRGGRDGCGDSAAFRERLQRGAGSPVRGGCGVSRRPSQCDLLLAVLRDGRWHSHAELVLAVPSIVHSRVADLRARGHVIVHEARGPGSARSLYRLVALAPSAEPDTGDGVSGSAGGDRVLSGSSSAGGAAAPGHPDGAGGLSPTGSPAPDPRVRAAHGGRPLSVGEVVKLLGRHGLVEWIDPVPVPLFDVAGLG